MASLNTDENRTSARGSLASGIMQSVKTAFSRNISPSKDGPEVLKVKELYIGMDIDEACEKINSLLGSVNNMTYRVTNFVEDVTVSFYGRPRYVIDGPNYGIGVPYHNIGADRNRKVIYINFNGRDVNYLFNTEGIEGEDFVREFISSYRIPNMEPWFLGEASGWHFVSPNGYEVVICGGNALTIKSIPKKTEMKFD
jgi:hypothetical protein